MILDFRFAILDWATPILLLACACARAEVIDKGDYHLFNPTPREYMREMATDRPDKTESPYTVDAGHYQIEMSIIDTSSDLFNIEQSGRDTETLSYAPMNLKAGLLNNVDLQLVIQPHIHQRTRDKTDDDGNGVQEDVVQKASGYGDMQTRLKINIWGNDGGSTAFAAMPYIKIPTADENLGNGATEGGLILPLAVELPSDWSMGIMGQYDAVQNADTRDYHAECVHTITVGHSIIGDLAGYVEFFSNVSTEDGSELVATLDFGLTYALSDDIQLDAGVNVGITRAADDLNPFCGISARF